MIQLHQDYLFVETAPGQIIPCSAELVAVELIGESAGTIDPQVVQEAAAAVLHYFRHDLGWKTVSVGEFSRALEQALQSLGVRLEDSTAKPQVQTIDLRQIASSAERGFELSFFPKLRTLLKSTLVESPQVLRFHGLRGCVKKLVGAKRWSQRCQTVNDQIVNYLRACLASEAQRQSCDLVIV
jgi:hypothetical protein